MESWTIRQILEWTAKDLARRGIGSPRLDAEVLLAHALGTSRLGLYLDLDRPLTELERQDYRAIVARRREREPVAYVTGSKEFWSQTFAVTPDTLVPRPDTEVLVEEALALLPGDGEGLRAVDVGSGSGCIGLTLALERPELRLLSIDLDRRAARVTARNAQALGVAARVAVAVGDLLAPARSPVDLIVANLPYIPSAEIEELEPEVSRWEPRAALDGGVDGLDLLRHLIDDCPRVLSLRGYLILEVGHDEQAQLVASLLVAPLEVVKIRRDYGGVQRVVVARLR